MCVVPSKLLGGTYIYYIRTLIVFQSFSVLHFESIPDISVLTLGTFSCMPSIGQEIPMFEEQSVSSDVFLWAGMKCKDNWFALVFSNDFCFECVYAQVCGLGIFSADVIFLSWFNDSQAPSPKQQLAHSPTRGIRVKIRRVKP